MFVQSHIQRGNRHLQQQQHHNQHISLGASHSFSNASSNNTSFNSLNSPPASAQQSKSRSKLSRSSPVQSRKSRQRPFIEPNEVNRTTRESSACAACNNQSADQQVLRDHNLKPSPVLEQHQRQRIFAANNRLAPESTAEAALQVNEQQSSNGYRCNRVRSRRRAPLLGLHASQSLDCAQQVAADSSSIKSRIPLVRVGSEEGTRRRSTRSLRDRESFSFSNNTRADLSSNNTFHAPNKNNCQQPLDQIDKHEKGADHHPNHQVERETTVKKIQQQEEPAKESSSSILSNSRRNLALISSFCYNFISYQLETLRLLTDTATLNATTCNSCHHDCSINYHSRPIVASNSCAARLVNLSNFTNDNPHSNGLNKVQQLNINGNNLIRRSNSSSIYCEANLRQRMISQNHCMEPVNRPIQNNCCGNSQQVPQPPMQVGVTVPCCQVPTWPTAQPKIFTCSPPPPPQTNLVVNSMRYDYMNQSDHLGFSYHDPPDTVQDGDSINDQPFAEDVGTNMDYYCNSESYRQSPSFGIPARIRSSTFNETSLERPILGRQESCKSTSGCYQPWSTKKAPNDPMAGSSSFVVKRHAPPPPPMVNRMANITSTESKMFFTNTLSASTSRNSSSYENSLKALNTASDSQLFNNHTRTLTNDQDKRFAVNSKEYSRDEKVHRRSVTNQLTTSATANDNLNNLQQEIEHGPLGSRSLVDCGKMCLSLPAGDNVGTQDASRDKASSPTRGALSDSDSKSAQQSCDDGLLKVKPLKRATSPLKLSLIGAKRRLWLKQKGLSSISVQRSEEVAPAHARHLVGQNSVEKSNGKKKQQMAALSLPPIRLNESISSFIPPAQPIGSADFCATDPRASFVEGLGQGQIASRQALVSPYLGDIQLTLTDQRGMLEVEVVRARRLHSKVSSSSVPAPFVKVYLMREKKCISKCRTSKPVGRTLDPLFQEKFIFRNDYTDCILQVIVWGDYGKKQDRKSLMGIVQIQLNKLDISNMIIGWYQLFNAPSMANSLVASSKSLRHTMLSFELSNQINS